MSHVQTWPKQSCRVRRLSAYVDTTYMYTRTFGKHQLVKQLCACQHQEIFMTEMSLLLKKLEESLAIATGGITCLCSFPEQRWNHYFHCAVTGRWQARLLRQAKYMCNLSYHSSSIFRHTNYSLLNFVVACNHENKISKNCCIYSSKKLLYIAVKFWHTYLSSNSALH